MLAFVHPGSPTFWIREEDDASKHSKKKKKRKKKHSVAQVKTCLEQLTARSIDETLINECRQQLPLQL